MKTISGHTQPFAVLGHPIGHTLSPPMHNAAFEALDMDAIYLAFDVAPERLMSVLPSMANMGFRGVNLTVPLKEVAFAGLTELDDSAKRFGSVNTVEFSPSGLKGHSTDGVGFLRAIDEAFGVAIKGLDVFVLGCGGAGRAVAIMCATQGAARLALCDIDEKRCLKLQSEIAGIAPGLSVSAIPREKWSKAARESELAINATPIGMRPGETSLLPPDAFRSGQMAFDLIYNIPQTPFTQAAQAGGAKAVNGLGMLLHQGAASFAIWTGREPPVAVMRRALEQALYPPH